MGEEPREPISAEEHRRREEQEEREFDEAVKRMNARVHKHMGMTAAVLGLIAAGVALWRLSAVLGVSPLEALGGAMPLFLLCLIILAIGALFSFGTSRVAFAVERLVKRLQKKAGE